MITAAQAKEKTMEKIQQQAKEFIINYVEQAIYSAIAESKFKATVDLTEVDNPTVIGEAVVELLAKEGFAVDHIYYDNVNGYANYISIRWED